MFETLFDIPEINVLDGAAPSIRIPPEQNVPLTERIRALIDTRAFRRLTGISQLGLVSLVYPGARHSRFEHSLGVYRLTLLYLRQLAGDPRFVAVVSPAEAELLIAASLLHDIGHWPFCHPIEDMQLSDVPQHEQVARQYLCDSEIRDVLERHWQLAPERVADFLESNAASRASRLLAGILSGPIDADKMDYLMRDSLHAGVPYGRNFDQPRLIGSLCINETGNGLAISEKGRTASEMMVFARYVMFSEVYWHHAVRAATAMLQRAFYLLRHSLNLDVLFRKTEGEFVGALLDEACHGPAGPLLEGLFGPTRRLYKRLREVDPFEDPQIHRNLARRPYQRLVELSHRLAERLSSSFGLEIRPEQVLIDAPPVKLEVEIDVDVFYQRRSRYRSLGQVSPVAQTLAKTQFDTIVKKVRVFVDQNVLHQIEHIKRFQEKVTDCLTGLAE
jgi:HD superfamily phosphohydrolase